MYPLTHSINKQLLPLFDKPMFYYPLSLMMLCGIKDFIFIINKNQQEKFEKAIGNQKDLGIKIKFLLRQTKRFRCLYNYRKIYQR